MQNYKIIKRSCSVSQFSLFSLVSIKSKDICQMNFYAQIWVYYQGSVICLCSLKYAGFVFLLVVCLYAFEMFAMYCSVYELIMTSQDVILWFWLFPRFRPFLRREYTYLVLVLFQLFEGISLQIKCHFQYDCIWPYRDNYSSKVLIC